jgi:hypothetical protein
MLTGFRTSVSVVSTMGQGRREPNCGRLPTRGVIFARPESRGGEIVMSNPRRRRALKRARDKANKRLIRVLLAGCESPGKALELHYWSREPGLLDIMRGIVMMSEGARAAIEAFVLLARDTRSVTANLDQRGLLTLASAQLTQSVALAQYEAANEGADHSRPLH